MRSLVLTFLFGSALLFLTFPTRAQIVPFTNDVWDVSQGNVVTDNSTTLISDIRGMFGFVNPNSVEPGTVIFQDSQPLGTVHFVEWMTTAPNTITGIQLAIAHDGNSDASRRGISEFSLYAKSTETNQFDQLVFQYFPANPYGDSIAPPGGAVRTNVSSNELYLCATFEPVTAQELRAEFVQFGEGLYTGPRVMELDGFVESRPRCFQEIFISSFEAGE